MRKGLIILGVVLGGLSLVGCGNAVRQMNHSWSGYAKVCVDGVSYVTTSDGIVVQRNLADKPVECH